MTVGFKWTTFAASRTARRPPACTAPTGADGFSPVGTVCAWFSSANVDPSRGSGFLIHPQALVTAAHVVVRWNDVRPRPSGWISVRLGQDVHRVTRFAVPSEYLESGGYNHEHDIALLALDEPVCNSEDTIWLDDYQGTGTPMTLFGARCGYAVSANVFVMRDHEMYRYHGLGDLPTWSGGPILKPACAKPADGAAVGVHVTYDNRDGTVSSAVALNSDALSQGLDRLRIGESS